MGSITKITASFDINLRCAYSLVSGRSREGGREGEGGGREEREGGGERGGRGREEREGGGEKEGGGRETSN